MLANSWYISVFVDTDGEKCVTVSFNFGGDGNLRQYEIRSIQYEWKNEVGGPQGCLQYFNTDSGASAVSSFNYAGGMF